MINFKGFSSLEKLPEKLHIYTGVFLKEMERVALLDVFKPKHQNIYADHVTFWYKPDLDQVRFINKTNSPITQEFAIQVTGYAEDEKAQAVSVKFPWIDFTGIVIKNELLHITISCAEGTSPVYSNELLKNAVPYREGVVVVGQLGVCSHSDRTYLPQGIWKRRGL